MHKPPALMSAFLAATLVIAGVNVAGMAVATEKWTATKLDASAYPADIVENTLEPAPGGLPDGRVATASSGDIRKAWYQSPTTRYAHAVLGDNVEAGELKVEDARGRSASLRLPENEVFEDITPRIADLDNDGLNEVVTIRSSVSKGASVTIYGMANGVLMQKATTGFIGTANRWLNIAAIAPMAGSGGQEIAFVRTPHIGGDLFIAAYAKGVFIQVTAMQGFSDHVIGSGELRLSAVADINGDGKQELALPSQDRKTLRIVGFVGRELKEIATAQLDAAIDKAIGVETSEGRISFITGLEDGSVWRIAPN